MGCDSDPIPFSRIPLCLFMFCSVMGVFFFLVSYSSLDLPIRAAPALSTPFLIWPQLIQYVFVSFAFNDHYKICLYLFLYLSLPVVIFRTCVCPILLLQTGVKVFNSYHLSVKHLLGRNSPGGAVGLNTFSPTTLPHLRAFPRGLAWHERCPFLFPSTD